MSAEVEIAALTVQVKKLEDDVHDLKTDVKAIRSAVDQSKGGWKVVLAVAGVAGATGATLAKIGLFFGK